MSYCVASEARAPVNPPVWLSVSVLCVCVCACGASVSLSLQGKSLAGKRLTGLMQSS